MKIKTRLDLLPALFLFILFPFIQQRTLDEVPGIVPTLYKYGSFLAACCIYSKFFIMHEIHIRKHIWIFLPFWGAYIISTVLGSLATLPRMIFNAFILFSLVLFIYMEIRNNLELLLQMLSYIYGGFIFMNMVLDFVFPGGLYKTEGYHAAHLLGDDNAIVFVALPGLAIMICYSLLKLGKISWLVWAEIAITEITLLRLWSVSAMAMVTMFIFMLIFVLKIGNINGWLLFAGVMFAMFVVLFGLTNQYVQSFIVNVLHKDATLSGRTILWHLALEMVAEKPVFGYGGYYEAGRFALSATYTYSAHTPYMQMLIDGGIVLFISFFIVPIAAFRQVEKHKGNIFLGVLSCAMTCMMVNYITEQVRFFHFFLLAAIMMNIDAFPEMTRKEVGTRKNGGINLYGKILSFAKGTRE